MRHTLLIAIAMLAIPVQAAPVNPLLNRKDVVAEFKRVAAMSDRDGQEHGFIVDKNGMISEQSGDRISVKATLPVDAQMLVHTHPSPGPNMPSVADVENIKKWGRLGGQGISIVLGSDRDHIGWDTIYMITPDGKVSFMGRLAK